MYWILGNENIDLSILGITIPRLPVSSTVWQGDSSPMKLSYLTDRFVKRGKMDGHCPNPLSLAGLDQWLNTLLSCLLMREGWSGIGVVHRVQDFICLSSVSYCCMLGVVHHIIRRKKNSLHEPCQTCLFTNVFSQETRK